MISKRTPRFENVLRMLRREPTDRPVLFEFFLNQRLYRRLLGDRMLAEQTPLAYARNMVRAFAAAGYDYGLFAGGWLFDFKRNARPNLNTVSLNEGAIITDRAGFEAYTWPDPSVCDYSSLRMIENDMPDGMKLMIYTPNGVLENVISLVGYDNLCLLLLDDPRLAADIFERVGETLLAFYRRALQFRSVGLVMVNDDWGFKTQPMLAPAQMREYVFPWHRRIVETAHAAGRPAVLHACGNLELLMDDIIDDLKYDGKHSYEDGICPVEDAYRRWNERVAILGGIDIDYMVRSPPEAIYNRARRLLEMAPTGYGLGTGNSVPEFIPDENYFAMTRAALE